jgi:hypothetical protein
MNATAMARAALALEAAAREHRDTLDLQGLALETLPPWPQGLVALRRIELGGNRLQALPPELWQASALEHLGLAGNRLQRLDPGIGRLQRLQTLDLSGNLLGTLPDELGQCASLTHLKLGANRLQTLPPCLARLTGLRVLDLHGNQLRSATVLASLTALEELQLDDNALTEIPHALRLLPKLRVFSARANPLENKSLGGPPKRLIHTRFGKARGYGFTGMTEDTMVLGSIGPVSANTAEAPAFALSRRTRRPAKESRPPAPDDETATVNPVAPVDPMAAVAGVPAAAAAARARPPGGPRPAMSPGAGSPRPEGLDALAQPASSGAEPPEAAAAARAPAMPAAAAASAWSAPPSPPRPSSPAEPVDAAVFCPPRVARESVFLVQVFAYPPGAEAQVEAQAQQADAAAERRGSWSLPLDVPRGTRIDLRLEMPGLVVAEPDAALVWRGRATAAQFEVGVPAGAAGANAIGRVRFAIDGVPAGTLRFQVALLAAGSGSTAAGPQPVQAQRYRRAFVSYSSKDRPEVLRRVQAFKIAGLSVFQDILDLDPGERWERALYREIDGCDVFLLFWSHAAADSPWVAREIEYALARKAGDEERPPAIQPVPIEGPPIVPPPAALGGLHFNDALLAQIAVAEAARPAAPPAAGP